MRKVYWKIVLCYTQNDKEPSTEFSWKTKEVSQTQTKTYLMKATANRAPLSADLFCSVSHTWGSFRLFTAGGQKNTIWPCFGLHFKDNNCDACAIILTQLDEEKEVCCFCFIFLRYTLWGFGFFGFFFWGGGCFIVVFVMCVCFCFFF